MPCSPWPRLAAGVAAGRVGDPACPRRRAAAARLGAERRRLLLVASLLSLAVPVVPYLSGAWETGWTALAATWLGFPLRVGLFLLAFHLLFALALLPLAFYGGYALPRAFGLGRQRVGAWLADWAKATALGAGLGTLTGGAFLWSVRAFGDGWWWAFGLVSTLGTLLLVFLMPYVLLPVFFKMRPLAEQPAAERLRALVRRAGAAIHEVCSLDFSRRTAEANAAVVGIGRSRRLVVADTLLADFPPAEVDAVVAHELGHHLHGDVQRLLVAHLALVWAGLALGAWAAPLALPLLSLPSLAYVPGYPVLLAVAELFLLLVGPLGNWWSRRLEAAADRFALRLTADPGAFASAMRRLGCQNLVEIQPPRWAELLLGSHPALGRRIALAERWSE